MTVQREDETFSLEKELLKLHRLSLYILSLSLSPESHLHVKSRRREPFEEEDGESRGLKRSMQLTKYEIRVCAFKFINVD
jgi:hypothetical protein